MDLSDKPLKHYRGGNCWAPPTRSDVCSKHEQPRGECDECPRCPRCDDDARRGGHQHRPPHLAPLLHGARALEWEAGYDQATREVLSEVKAHDMGLYMKLLTKFPKWREVTDERAGGAW